MLSANAYYEHIRCLFEAKGNPSISEQQRKYLKNQFDFFGLKAPVWAALLKDELATNGVLSAENLVEFIETCFEDDCREMHYAAIEMAQKAIKKQPEPFIDTLEEMIKRKSWWDSVDTIATKLVGVHFQRFPHLIVPYTEKWMASENIWLQRVCIIFQLRYKQKTDLALLSKYILAVADSKEFFLRKAAGWALRDLSKHNPTFVRQFVEAHPELSNLTKKEALRLIS
jgi:3-methyladenine DNA glycosylase AlkD